MGSFNTKLYKAYAKTPKNAIAALDAKLYFKHSGRVQKNFLTGQYFVVVNGRCHYVQVERTPVDGVYCAFITHRAS